MPLNFPSSPTLNQTHALGDRTWKWNGTGWQLLSNGSITSNSLTFDNSGAGAASGGAFNGSSAVTVSYNTVGAPSTTGTNATGTWGISITGNAATATTATNWGGIPNGTIMLFQQTAAPTGWTKLTTHDNKALRVVSGTASSGGTTGFTTVFTSRTPSGSVSVGGSIDQVYVTGTVTVSGTVGNTTLTTAQIPSHAHNITVPFNYDYNASGGSTAGIWRNTAAATTASVGSDQSHNHSFTGSGSFGSNLHNHTFTGSGSFAGNSMDFAVAYVDIILASKN